MASEVEKDDLRSFDNFCELCVYNSAKWCQIPDTPMARMDLTPEDFLTAVSACVNYESPCPDERQTNEIVNFSDCQNINHLKNDEGVLHNCVDIAITEDMLAN